MENDDLPVGRLLTRREILTLMGLTGAAVLAACAVEEIPTETAAGPTTAPTGIPPTASATGAAAVEPTTGATATLGLESTTAPACVVLPELTEGPFFFDLGLDRSDIRTDTSDGSRKDGLPLDVAVVVSGVDANGCVPLEGALVDLWQCDADGVYSGTGAAASRTFLRGNQMTDSAGRAAFTTIYPGWYPGRAVHIHFKIRYPAGAGGSYEFTSQFFFDDAFSAQVFEQAPYAARGLPNTSNSADFIYRNGGDRLVLEPAASGDGLACEFGIALDLTDSAIGGED